VHTSARVIDGGTIMEYNGRGVMKMNNHKNRLFLGLALIVLGVLFVLDRSGLIDFNLFFDGWWTLFLIVPGIYSMTKQGIQFGNALLVCLGAFFLLDARGWNYTQYILPAALVLLGVLIVFKKN
jgi:hypothetical protein